MTTQTIAAIIVAAGSSSRMGGGVPKPYRALGGKAVIAHSYDALASHSAISQVLVVANPTHKALLEGALPQAEWVAGGPSRQASVRLGLEALANRTLADNPPDAVLIHDAARPFLSAGLIDRLTDALQEYDAVVPVVPVTDTIRQSTPAGLKTLPRAALLATQTPQAFVYAEILAAHQTASGREHTDDAALAEAAGMGVATVEGDAHNKKLTTPEDWAWAQAQLVSLSHSAPGAESLWDSASSAEYARKDRAMRIGQGFDVHRLMHDEARKLMLCGLEVPSELALEGHSDADVALHALTDALLGAIGQGDIGQHFPPSDERWKNADSAAFVAEAMRRVREAGYGVVNADITLVCERPKIGPHREAMRARVAALLGADEGQVNIKATTTEGLGFTGRGEGIAAQAVVMLQAGE